MKTLTRPLFIRAALLASAMAAAYQFGRSPGVTAKGVGELAAVWRRFIAPLAPPLPNTFKSMPFRDQGRHESQISIQEAENQITEILADNSSQGRLKRNQAIGDLLDHVAAADKLVLFHWACAMPDGMDKQMLQQRIGSNLITSDPKQALSVLESISDQSLRQVMIRYALSDLAFDDPQQALRELQNLPPNVDKDSLYSDLLGDIAEKDPALASTLVVGLPNGSIQNSAIFTVSTAWAKTDPQAALNWLQSLPGGGIGFLTNFFNSLSSQNPKFVADNLDKVTNRADRINLIEDLSRSWVSDPGPGFSKPDVNPTPAASIDLANQLPAGTVYASAIDNVFSHAAADDPSAAADVLDKISDPRVKLVQINNLATTWGATDPAGALAWANSLTGSDAGARDQAVRTVVSSWASIDPAAAAAYLQNSPDPSLLLSIAPEIAQAWVSPGSVEEPTTEGDQSSDPYLVQNSGVDQPPAASDPSAALAFVNTLPDSDSKNQALNNVLVGMANTNFDAAWNYTDSLPDGANRTTILTNLVGTEASNDPVLAATMLGQLPTPAAQVTATSTLAATWVKQDPQSFTDWLGTLPEGDVRDTAIAQLADSSQAKKYPAVILEWVNTITNPQTKATLLQSLTPATAAATR